MQEREQPVIQAVSQQMLKRLQKSLIRYIHFVDIYTISLIQKIIKREMDRLKDHAIYGVDTMEQLQYVRGQIKS